MARMLIVDDDEMIAQVMVNYFEDQGYDVRFSLCAEDALTLLESFDADYLMTDLGLPGMNGFDLIAYALFRKPSLKCLIMTGAIEDVPVALASLGISSRNMVQKPERLEIIEKRILSL
jgi:DNA-binding NtrC family response regulator